MESNRVRKMKHKNLIMETKIRKNWDEIRLLVKLFELSKGGVHSILL